MSTSANKLMAVGAGEERDDDFNLVGPLIHANGSNAGTNASYIDSSDENHTISSASNNQYQGTFSPYSLEEGKWSVLFDGNADFIEIASSSDFGMGTGDFTWEAWIYQTARESSTWQQLFSTDNYSTGTNISVWITSAGLLDVYETSSTHHVADTAFTLCTWNHVAFVRASGTFKTYLNGHEVASASMTTDFPTDGLIIGRSNTHTSTSHFEGYISNFRIVKGTAVYTGDFTVPTGPLTAITNTKLLCLCSNHFKDKSASGHTLSTGSGSPFSFTRLPQVEAFSPFKRSKEYDPAVHGGSMWVTHDGNIYASDATDFDFGTGDYSIECWVYPTATLNTSWALLFGTIGENQYWGYTDGGGSEGSAGFSVYNSPHGPYSASFSHLPRRYTWNHIVFQHTSGTMNWYLNGTRIYNATSNMDHGSTPTGMYVGRTWNYGTTYGFEGYMSDVRIMKGANAYTNASTLTVPTAPLTKTNDTKLLLNFTNASIIDSTGMTNIETIGDTQLDTSVKKFGTASMEFDGTADRARNPVSTYNLGGYSFPLGTGDFTIECFVYFDTVAYKGIWQLDTSSLGGNAYYAPVLLVYNHSGTMKWSTMTTYGGNAMKVATTGSITPSANTWYHTAVVRTNGTVKVFVDGTQNVPDFTDATSYNDRDALTIGGFYSTDYLMDGYVDEFRITRKARYTSNFTAPTKEFLNF
jgi:hypothetical protein